MPGCMLRAASPDFRVDEFLKSSTFVAWDVFRQGEPRGRQGSLHDKSGFAVVVSEASGDDLPRQIADAADFLERHREEILRLQGCLGSKGTSLDFGVWQRGEFGHYCYFPPKLLQLAGALGVGIELSIYVGEVSLTPALRDT